MNDASILLTHLESHMCSLFSFFSRSIVFFIFPFCCCVAKHRRPVFNFAYEMTREKFDELIDDIITRCVEPCKKCLKDAGIDR